MRWRRTLRLWEQGLGKRCAFASYGSGHVSLGLLGDGGDCQSLRNLAFGTSLERGCVAVETGTWTATHWYFSAQLVEEELPGYAIGRAGEWG